MKKNDNPNIQAARAAEKLRASEYAVAVTDFFSPGEIMDIYSEISGAPNNGIARCFFWGGCLGAERRAAVFLPEWYMPDGAPKHSLPNDEERNAFFASYLAQHPEILTEIPITALRIKGSSFCMLSHRDYMGAVLALGIDRSVVGDIAVISQSEAIVFAADRIVPFIMSELTKIGRDGVSVTKADIPVTWAIPRIYESFTIVVSSPRLDGIVKAITGKSREESAELVRAGLVDLSYVTAANVSAQVSSGDVISIRGFGKYVIGDVKGETKSGRLRMECRKYL